MVPFLKVDKGLGVEKDGVQLMKPMPALAALLEKAKIEANLEMKMRSVIAIQRIKALKGDHKRAV